MCGNTVSHDRRFLSKYMPQLEAYFNYRHIDVSSVKEVITGGLIMLKHTRRTAVIALKMILESPLMSCDFIKKNFLGFRIYSKSFRKRDFCRFFQHRFYKFKSSLKDRFIQVNFCIPSVRSIYPLYLFICINNSLLEFSWLTPFRYSLSPGEVTREFQIHNQYVLQHC